MGRVLGCGCRLHNWNYRAVLLPGAYQRECFQEGYPVDFPARSKSLQYAATIGHNREDRLQRTGLLSDLMAWRGQRQRAAKKLVVIELELEIGAEDHTQDKRPAVVSDAIHACSDS
jgi:hypothetical protein